MEDRGPTVFTVTLVLSILATVFVGLRLCSKWYIVKRNNSDDVLVVISWVGVSDSRCFVWHYYLLLSTLSEYRADNH